MYIDLGSSKKCIKTTFKDVLNFCIKKITFTMLNPIYHILTYHFKTIQMYFWAVQHNWQKYMHPFYCYQITQYNTDIYCYYYS